MKKNAVGFLAMVVCLAALSLPALAQSDIQGQGQSDTQAQEKGYGHHGRMPSVDERVQHLTKALNLNADQQTKVKSILQDQQNQMMSLRQDSSMSQADRRAKFQQIHQDSQQKIRALLNDDQKAKFDQMKEKRQEPMHRHGGDTGGSDKS